MAKNFLVAPATHDSGLTAISLGLVRAFQRRAVKVAFFKPIAQPKHGEDGEERSTALIRQTTDLRPPEPIDRHVADDLMGEGDINQLMEAVVEKYEEAARGADLVVIEGLTLSKDINYANAVNSALARTLDAQVILTGKEGNVEDRSIRDVFEIMANNFPDKVDACILNKVKVNSQDKTIMSHQEIASELGNAVESAEMGTNPVVEQFAKLPFSNAGVIPWRSSLFAQRVCDIALSISAQVLNYGNWDERRIYRNYFSAGLVDRESDKFRSGDLVIIPAERQDLLAVACLRFLGGVQIAGVILCGSESSAENMRLLSLIKPATDLKLPVLYTKDELTDVLKALDNVPSSLPLNDPERLNETMNVIANHINIDWLDGIEINADVRRCSPPAFRHRLINMARQANKLIVLPEGEEERTIEAAVLCVERKMSRCLLLGDPEVVKAKMSAKGLPYPDGLTISKPKDLLGKYIDTYVELRKHKGMTKEIASEVLEDSVVLGTMMLKVGDVDGLVSGAVHTTANTIRPALQLIKTKPGSDIVSSVFFMCLPDQVVVYGDCAVNPDPTAEQLAAIAVDCSESAKAFGLPARTAMISYSTGESGSGSDVDKVRKATALAREKAPELMIDGPLQYDAASEASVARSKAPNSKVAGDATVFVFPDLNTGNTTYKAVQRSAKVVSIGPMLQGLAKPVNDLSRGALVEDIVYTIALTAIQAQQGS